MGNKPYLIIPAYDGYPQAKEDLQNLLNSIKRGGIGQFTRVLIMLDGANRIFHTEMEKAFPEFEFQNHKGNRKNFCGNASTGLRRARAEGVGAFVVNQDCILGASPYLEKMTNTKGMSCSYTADFSDKSFEEVLGALEAINKERANNPPIDVQTLPGGKVAGYCFFISAEALQEVGVLDDNSFKGSCEDDDITVRMLLAGRPVELLGTTVYHAGSHMQDNSMSRSGAYGVADGSLQLHLNKFYQKWNIPGNIKHEDAWRWILQNYVWDPNLPQMKVE